MQILHRACGLDEPQNLTQILTVERSKMSLERQAITR
jgi:hypothetical protein